ncbi:MAG TPA: hypothetical protein VIA62_19035 [Thermoanaerobaculia bacterium]|jgi:hypothetical protein|nr:hypothetical protein [Thermoanaerobaculia bacterium]
MRSANVFGAKITNWDLANTNVKPHLAEMPQVQPLQAELEAVIVEARSLDSRQELARSQARDLTRQRQDIEKRGEDLRRRIASHLRGTFGFTSEQLVQFGVNPRPRVSRRKKPVETPAPPPAPPPAAK